MAPPLVGHAKLAIAQVDLRHVGEAEAWRV
jgi:hypothetical protein